MRVHDGLSVDLAFLKGDAKLKALLVLSTKRSFSG